MTTLTYLGHACFFFETEKAACLIDPWLSPKGAFLGTWRQLPPNDHCLQWVLDKMKAKPVMIYVTHEHEDHYDEETLKKILPHAAGLYTPNYENTFLKSLMENNLGIQPHLVDEDDAQAFHDIEFKIFIDESGINRDSAIYLKADGLTFLNVNDCKIYDRASWLVEKCGTIDIISVQFSGANMHPICYDLSQDDYYKISRQKRMRKFVAVRNFINALAPRYYVPSAGPAVFPYEQHEDLNFQKDNIFPRWWDFRDYLESKGTETKFIPLDTLGAASGTDGGITFDGLAEPFADDKVKEMINYYRNIDKNNPAPPCPPKEEVIAFFESEMQKKINVLKQHSTVRFGNALHFEIRDESGDAIYYFIDPDKHACTRVERDHIRPPYYHHTTTVEALGRLMLSGKSWGTYFLSFLFRSERDPDVFDSAMGTFFVSNDDHDLDFGLRKLTEWRESDEYITLPAPDGKRTVTCKRFCPHQGADLKYAAFDGKYVICPRHQWKFDCENGGVADNSSDTIDATIGTCDDRKAS